MPSEKVKFIMFRKYKEKFCKVKKYGVQGRRVKDIHVWIIDTQQVGQHHVCVWLHMIEACAFQYITSKNCKEKKEPARVIQNTVRWHGGKVKRLKQHVIQVALFTPKLMCCSSNGQLNSQDHWPLRSLYLPSRCNNLF